MDKTLFCILAKSFSTQSYRNMSSKPLRILNFAFIDLETTGLPSYECNKTKITELSIAVVESEHIRLGVFPRIRNKLNLCFNPAKLVTPVVTELTGLSNDILENQSYFSHSVVNIINDFLNLQKKPICLVAHNGNKFDYPILQASIINAEGNLNEDILCIDSLCCFQDLHDEMTVKLNQSSKCNQEESLVIVNEEVNVPKLKKQKVMTGVFLQNPEISDEYDQLLCNAVDEYEKSCKHPNIQKVNETTPKKQIIKINTEPAQPRKNATIIWERNRTSFKLCDIYKRLTHKDPEHSHHAEGDVDCLIHCAAVYGDDFVEWANRNAKLFSTIPAMRPDLETTGLPSEENNRTRITELNITVVESAEIYQGKHPRVRDKLNLCFNPGKFINPYSTEITGLSNDILENKSLFSLDIANLINRFLSLQKRPICLVAHNGNGFDYPILKAEIQKVQGELMEDILCMDSLICFRNLNNEKPREICSSSENVCTEYPENSRKSDDDTSKNKKQRLSFKLGDIYKRLTHKEFVDAHQAEGDVDCLIECAAACGKDFVDWANANAKLFSTIREMKPGVKFGC